jgi:hypothetical protein
MKKTSFLTIAVAIVFAIASPIQLNAVSSTQNRPEFNQIGPAPVCPPFCKTSPAPGKSEAPKPQRHPKG